MSASNPPAGKPPASLAPAPPSVGKQAKQAETAEDAPPEIKKESNPFTEGDWHMIVYAWFGLAVRVVLVVGAVFSVYQFLVAREETRIQRALEMVQLWEQPEYQEAQRAVKKRIDALNTKYADLLADQQTASTRSILRKKIGLEAMTPNGGRCLPRSSRSSSTGWSISSTGYRSASRVACVPGTLSTPISATTRTRSGSISRTMPASNAKRSRRPTRSRSRHMCWEAPRRRPVTSRNNLPLGRSHFVFAVACDRFQAGEQPSREDHCEQRSEQLGGDEAWQIDRADTGKSIRQARAMATAGLANDVEAVNQYAAVI